MRISILPLIVITLVCLQGLRVRAAEGACPVAETLGTARTLAVGGGVAIGLKTYPQTLDLEDHEVVLTFDDGPSPTTTPQILDALAAQCVRATFFIIGRNAAAAPALVRREVADGHTVGHHTWSHPAVTLRGLSDAAAITEIDRGMMADDKAAYGVAGAAPRVPFFRFPGFADSQPLLDHLVGRGITVFGADLWASDWVPMTPEVELERLMARLEKARRGIILLHDTKEQTAAMLPAFLGALRASGYRVVHIVPGRAGMALRHAPAGWMSETESTLAHVWPHPGPRGPFGNEAQPGPARPSPASALDRSLPGSSEARPSDDLSGFRRVPPYGHEQP